jgi:hypothetical protein
MDVIYLVNLVAAMLVPDAALTRLTVRLVLVIVVRLVFVAVTAIRLGLVIAIGLVV